MKVLVVGAGGIAVEVMRLFAPFEVEFTIVRRSADPLPGAQRTVNPRLAPGSTELGQVCTLNSLAAGPLIAQLHRSSRKLPWFCTLSNPPLLLLPTMAVPALTRRVSVAFGRVRV